MNVIIVLAVVTVFVGIVSYAAYTDVLFGTYYPLLREAYGKEGSKIDENDYVGFLAGTFRKLGGRFDADKYIAA